MAETPRQELERLRAAQPVQEPPRAELTRLRSIGNDRSVTPDLQQGAVSTAGNIGTSIVAGLAGVAQGANELLNVRREPDSRPVPEFISPEADFNKPAERVRSIQSAGAELFAPQTTTGQAGVEAIAGTVEKAAKAVKFPLSAVPFATAELLEGGNTGGEEKQKFLDMPIGDYLGELAQDNGASPLFATMAHLSPDVLLTAGGVKTGRTATKPGAPPPPKPPTVAQLKQQADVLYKTVDDAGLQISDKAFAAGVSKIERELAKTGVRQKLNPKTASAMDEIISDAKSGGITLSKSEELRRVINQAKAAVEPADQATAIKLGELFDDFIETLKPGDIAARPGATLNSVEVRQYLKSARSLWSRARKSDEIQDLLDKAEINVQSQQGNIGLSQAIRTQFRQLATNKRRLKRFSPSEREFIKRVATGDAIERAARTLGKIAPTQTIPILGEIGAVGAAVVTGNPALLAGAVALPVVGGLAKRISSSRTARFAQEAGEAIRRGQ